MLPDRGTKEKHPDRSQGARCCWEGEGSGGGFGLFGGALVEAHVLQQVVAALLDDAVGSGLVDVALGRPEEAVRAAESLGLPAADGEDGLREIDDLLLAAG